MFLMKQHVVQNLKLVVLVEEDVKMVKQEKNGKSNYILNKIYYKYLKKHYMNNILRNDLLDIQQNKYDGFLQQFKNI